MDYSDPAPDNVVLSAIFPDATPASVDVLASRPNTCTFKVHFDTAPSATLPQDLIVRLETTCGQLEAIVGLSAVAQMQIPGLVPETLICGKATLADGRDVEYSITPFVANTVALESVWPSLDRCQQDSLMETIVAALKKVQQLNIRVKSLGGPYHGHANSMQDFLAQFVVKHQMKSKPTSSIVDVPGGITIKSVLPELDDIFLSHQDLQALENDAVLCHNDMEPRNILVRRCSDAEPRYELAANIDWELSGFMPFAFEFACKHTDLGIASQHWDWYSLYTSKMQSMLPSGEHSIKLMDAVYLIVESRRMQWKRNVPKEIRQRWMAKEGLEMHETAHLGWVKKEGAPVFKFSQEVRDELEMQVLRDFGHVS
jgi:hypothetical protein